ncbi:MAG: hypothetical protein H7A30_00485 [Thermotogae bacterium]|nr:hypothetical protein [Thermotogota bacterium]
MKIKILGYLSAYPNEKAACSGYLFMDKNEKFIIDMGFGTFSRLPDEFKIPDFIIITHFHYDHFSDIFALEYYLKVQKQLGIFQGKIPVYAPEDGFFSDIINKSDVFDYNILNEKTIINKKTFYINFIKNYHSLENYSVSILNADLKTVYTSDTGYYEKLVSFAENSDLLMSECSLYGKYTGKVQGHMSSLESAKLALNSGSKKLLLTHIPAYGDVSILKKEASEIFDGEIFLAGNTGVLNLEKQEENL